MDWIKMKSSSIVQIALGYEARSIMTSLCLSAVQVGLQVLIQDGHVFECHKDIADAVFNAELGSSLAILRAGYTIDSLMLRYQGVDWTDPENWQCNNKYAHHHPP